MHAFLEDSLLTIIVFNLHQHMIGPFSVDPSAVAVAFRKMLIRLLRSKSTSRTNELMIGYADLIHTGISTNCSKNITRLVSVLELSGWGLRPGWLASC